MSYKYVSIRKPIICLLNQHYFYSKLKILIRSPLLNNIKVLKNIANPSENDNKMNSGEPEIILH